MLYPQSTGKGDQEMTELINYVLPVCIVALTICLCLGLLRSAGFI